MINLKINLLQRDSKVGFELTVIKSHMVYWCFKNKTYDKIGNTMEIEK